jgi:excinuclease ABC subunit A
LYLLDEPTTGLHFADIQNLLTALLELRDQGNTVLIIEHNLDVIKSCDYLIDLAPGRRSGGANCGHGNPRRSRLEKYGHWSILKADPGAIKQLKGFNVFAIFVSDC